MLQRYFPISQLPLFPSFSLFLSFKGSLADVLFMENVQLSPLLEKDVLVLRLLLQCHSLIWRESAVDEKAGQIKWPFDELHQDFHYV